jgi:hypothetical protein
MIDPKKYYFASFVRDLDTVIGTDIPRYFGGTWRTQGCPELEKVAEVNRLAFVTCLYYSVLLDQGLCHHAHDVYKNTTLFDDCPKFRAPGKGHMNPRGILRYPIHWGLVSSEGLMQLTVPAANLFIAEFMNPVGKLLPQVSLSTFFYLLTNFPEVNYWSPRVARRYAEETKVEQAFLAELINAWEQQNFGKYRKSPN